MKLHISSILIGFLISFFPLFADTKKTAVATTTENWQTEILPERVIYLLDVTNSMEGLYGSQKIFGKLKAQLDSALVKLAPRGDSGADSTEVIIVPFTEQTETPWQGSVEELRSRLDTLRSHKGYTNIIGAWNKGIELLDSLHTNFLFLLTDGIQNKHGSVNDLRKLLSQWGNDKSVEAYAFYVMLTHEAYDKKIKEDVAEKTANLWAIDTMTVNLRRIQAPRRCMASIYGLDNILMPVRVHGEIPQDLDFSLEYDTLDAYYRLQNISLSTEGIRMDIESLKDFKQLPDEHTLDLKVRANIRNTQTPYPLLFFTPEEYQLTIVNRTIRRVEIQPTGNTKVSICQEEPFQGFLSSRPWILVKSLEYPPYSWLKPDTIRQDISYAFTFNDQSVKDSARIAIKVMMKTQEGKTVEIKTIDFNATDESSKADLQLAYNPDWCCKSEDISFVPVDGFYADKARVQRINKQDISFLPKKINIPPYTVSIAQDKAWKLWIAWGVTALLLLILVILLIIFIVRLLSWREVNNCSFEKLKKRIEKTDKKAPKTESKHVDAAMDTQAATQVVPQIATQTTKVTPIPIVANIHQEPKVRCLLLVPYLLNQNSKGNASPQKQCEQVLQSLRDQKVEEDSKLLRQFYSFQVFALTEKKKGLWHDIDAKVVIQHPIEKASKFETPEDITQAKECVLQCIDSPSYNVCIVWGKDLRDCILNEFGDRLMAVKGFKKAEICSCTDKDGHKTIFCFMHNPSYPLFANSTATWVKRIKHSLEMAKQPVDKRCKNH